MKATFLIDNIASGDLKGEWGLSVFIENNGKKILLDAGTTGDFVDNADKLGIDLAGVDVAVLSHAHYDHADGFLKFFERNEKASLMVREGTDENCFHKFVIRKKYIGVKKGMLSEYSDRIEYVSGDYEIFDGVYLVPHKTPNLQSIGRKAGMYIIKGGRLVPDDFSHEQSLVIRTGKGLVIFNSCSHGGADNIINEIVRTFPEDKVYALIGGFHLFLSSDKCVRKLAEGIRETGIEMILTGHCTGERAYNILKSDLKDRAEQIRTGLVFEA